MPRLICQTLLDINEQCPEPATLVVEYIHIKTLSWGPHSLCPFHAARAMAWGARNYYEVKVTPFDLESEMKTWAEKYGIEEIENV